ncbi:MAG: UvrD-helicase domain-containing protein [Nitrospinota bacterium]
MASEVVIPPPPGLSPADAPLADAADRLRAVTTFARNVVVTAGAGTGKTALLSERLLNLLFRRRDPARPAQFAALTFTNRAAGEMAERLRQYLEKFVEWAAQGGPPAGRGDVPAGIYREIAGRYGWSPDEIGEIARRTLQELELVPISTYHSFAARLLRLYPLQAGVDPHFREDDGAVFEERFAGSWDEWLAGELQTGGGREPLWRRVLGEFDLLSLQGLARELCSEFISLDALEGALGDGTLFLAPSDWLHQEVAAAGALTERFEKDRKIEAWTRQAAQILEAFGQGLPEEDIRNLAAGIQGGMPNNVQGLSVEDYGACKRIITLARGLASLNRGALGDAMEALLPFARTFREDFVRSGFLSFDSLLVRARDLLRGHPAIRRELKERYRHLLVDEFQDTDPLQYEIVLYLAEEQGREARDWRDIRLEAGKLFIVGDPKQSIYSFRRADIRAYQDLLRNVVKEKPLELVVNFRSHDRIVGAVNRLFGRVIQRRETIQPDYVPAEPRPGGPANLEAQKVEIRVVQPEEGRTWKADEAAEGEAAEIARWIGEEWVGQVEIPDGKGKTRFVEYGDVALLFRKMTSVGVYVDALRERGIPHVVEAGRGFFETQEVSDFLNLLACLAYPEDRLALAGVLRSPLGGLTDREIFTWAEAGRASGPAGLSKASFLMERLVEVQAEIHRLPLSEALDRILTAFPVLESATLLAGEQGRNNVLKVRSLALEREGILEVGFSNLVDWLRRQGREIREEGESPLAEENINAVKLLTVHKAKGLEFPVVVLAGLHAGSRPPEKPVRVERDWSTQTWALRVGPVQTPGMAWAGDRAGILRDAEERRLLYVAATRARERLVFSMALRHDSKGDLAKAEGFLVYLNEALGIEARDETAEWPTIPDGKIARLFLTASPGKGAPSESKGEVSIPKTLESTWRERREKASQARRQRRDLSPSHLNDEEGEMGKPEFDRGRISRDRAIRVGIVAHAVMEMIDLKEPGPDIAESVRVALDEFLPRVPPKERREIGQEVERMVTGFLRSSDFQRKIQPFEILGREVPCFLPCDGAGELAGSVEGYIDLVLRDGEGVLAIDYKTDRVETSETGERAKRYERQGEIYCRALSDALGVDIQRFGVAFLRPAVFVTLSRKEA